MALIALPQGTDWPPAPRRTPRLVVRAPEPRDRAGLIQSLTSEDVRRHLGGAVPMAEAERATAGPYGRTPGSFVATLATSGDVAGTIGLDRRDQDRPGHLRDGGELEVSFLLLPEHWGRGLAAEGVSEVLTWAWETLDDTEVVSATQVANDGARRLLARLGFAEHSRFEEFGAAQSLWVLDRPPA